MSAALANALVAAVVLTLCFASALWTASDYRRRLKALRRNAYLRTEKGHLRRYAECSDAVQARAEV